MKGLPVIWIFHLIMEQLVVEVEKNSAQKMPELNQLILLFL